MASPRNKEYRPRTGWAESPHLDRELQCLQPYRCTLQLRLPGERTAQLKHRPRGAPGRWRWGRPLLGSVGGELVQRRLVDAAQIPHRLGRPVAPQGFQCREAVGLGRREVRCHPTFCQEQVAEAAQQGQVAGGCKSWGGGGAQKVGAKGIIAALRGGAGG